MSPGVAALVLGALALAVWPSAEAARRLRRTVEIGLPAARSRPPGWLAVAGVPLIAMLLGPAPGVAAGIVAAVWLRRARASSAERAGRTDQEELHRALAVMVAEMSVGAPMVGACRAAADELGGGGASRIAGELARIAAHVELGGELDGLVPGGPGIARIVQAWSTSVRHGLPMAALLEAVRRDLVQRRDFSARTQASLAGPRATAMVLAGLPLLGLGLGQLMGAHPVGVLLTSSLGGVLLIVGVSLAAAGVLWADAIVAKVLR